MNEVDAGSTKDPGNQLGGNFSAPLDLSLRTVRNEAEIYAISTALKHTGWNRKRAARLLRISYRGLLYKIRRHNITLNSEVANHVSAAGSNVG